MAIRSVTLAPGESYILPSGATIISTTGPITSECANLDNLEELQCYILPVYGAEKGGCGTPVWAEDNFWLDGISVSDIYYPFSGSLHTDDDGNFDYSLLITKINEISEVAPLFVDLSGDWAWDDACRGGVTTLCFKTLPSIADSIYLPLRTTLPNPSNSGIDIRAYVVLYDEFTGNGKCSCTTPEV